MLVPTCTCLAKAANLKCYNKEKSFGFPDLNQLCKNGRARGETKDKCLQTLTTNSGRIYSQAFSVGQVSLVLVSLSKSSSLDLAYLSLNRWFEKFPLKAHDNLGSDIDHRTLEK